MTDKNNVVEIDRMEVNIVCAGESLRKVLVPQSYALPREGDFVMLHRKRGGRVERLLHGVEQVTWDYTGENPLAPKVIIRVRS